MNLPGWIRERIPVEEVLAFLRRKTVPRHRLTWSHLFGGTTLFCFIVQVVSGSLLSIYYQPSPNRAHESVAYIMNEVSFGWLIRSIHSWTAHLMIASMIVHLAFKFFLRAYAAPRELTWVSGVVLLMIVLGFAFTGYLLPWDTVAYFATQIGTEVSSTVPYLGPFITSLLRSGEYIDDTTLTRVFGLHAIVLPLVTALFIAVHLTLNHHTGSAVPASAIGRTGEPIRFYPGFLGRDLRAWLMVSGVILTAALLAPPALGPKAEPLASAPLGIKPEWYFLPLFQSLKIVPGTIFGIDSAAVVNAGVVLAVTLLGGLPFIDRGPTGGAWSKLVRLGGFVAGAVLTTLAIMAVVQAPEMSATEIVGKVPELGLRVTSLVMSLFMLLIGMLFIRYAASREG